MNKCKVFIAALIIGLSYEAPAQIVECRISAIKQSFDCYEAVILKVQIRNKTYDTLCVDNIAHSFSGRPMKIYIEGEEHSYMGPRGTVFSGVFVSPKSDYCFYMEVLYGLPDDMAISRKPPGRHELHYHSDLYIVKNRRLTQGKIGRISGSVKYEVYCSQESESIACILREKSIVKGKRIKEQERYRLVYDLIEERGIDAVDRVAGYLIRVSGNIKGIQSDKVHEKAAKMKKKLTLSVPGECVCQWDE